MTSRKSAPIRRVTTGGLLPDDVHVRIIENERGRPIAILLKNNEVIQSFDITMFSKKSGNSCQYAAVAFALAYCEKHHLNSRVVTKNTTVYRWINDLSPNIYDTEVKGNDELVEKVESITQGIANLQNRDNLFLLES
jgi:hypothetical protein